MDPDIENELRQQLGANEHLLWTGRPKAGILFRSSDIILIPFSLVWILFVFFWEYNAIRSGISFMAFFGIPFIIMGLFATVGRFFIDALKRKNTLYAITDSRVIIKSGILNREIKSLPIRNMADLTYKEKADGTGTISMGASDFRYGMFRGVDYWPGVKLPPAFEMIEEVRKVYNILLEQQRKN